MLNKFCLYILMASSFLVYAGVEGQPAVMPSPRNGTYHISWHYKGNAKDSADAFCRLSFLNDSMFVFCFNGSDTTHFSVNTISYMDSWIGRLIRSTSPPRWYAIRDYSTPLIDTYYLEHIDDTAGRIHLKEAIRTAWDSMPKNSIRLLQNPYDIFAFFFDNGSCRIIPVRTSSPDNGEVGLHTKIDDKQLSFVLDTSGLSESHGTINGFVDGRISRDAWSLYLPVPERIPGNETGYFFRRDEHVLIGVQSYMDFVFIMTMDSKQKVNKYGWVRREKIKLIK